VNALQVAAVGQLEPQEVESPVHGVPPWSAPASSAVSADQVVAAAGAPSAAMRSPRTLDLRWIVSA
jgi:hypothetical protein